MDGDRNRETERVIRERERERQREKERERDRYTEGQRHKRRRRERQTERKTVRQKWTETDRLKFLGREIYFFVISTTLKNSVPISSDNPETSPHPGSGSTFLKRNNEKFSKNAFVFCETVTGMRLCHILEDKH